MTRDNLAKHGSLRRISLSLLMGGALAATGIAHAKAADRPTMTLSFVVGIFDPAGYYDPTGQDCPHGYNLHPIDFYPLELKRLGYTPEQIAELKKVAPNPDQPSEITKIMLMRGRDKDGNPVNVFQNPESEPDPHIYTVEGRYGFGFNLDELVKSGDFTDPKTGERGIDNNWYKVLGCFDNLKWEKGGVRAAYPDSLRRVTREEQPAHLIEITGIHDLTNDDDVEVSYMVSTDPLVRGADGYAEHDRSMRVDPDPRWQNKVHGHIKDGVLETDVFDVNAIGDPLLLFQVLRLRDGRLKLNLKPNADDTYSGLLGGYQKWRILYWTYGRAGQATETGFGINVPGYYHAIKRLADADPDPLTGENTSISLALDIVAVRAFLVKTPELPEAVLQK